MKNQSISNRIIRERFALTIVMFFGFMANCASQSITGAKPNIILIMADDLGFGDVGFNGQQLIKTPNLDRLAQSGRRFTNFYAGSSVCAPSRESILTGRHTGHTYIRGNFRLAVDDGNLPLSPRHPTIAEVLKTAGYKTAMFGKWGVGDSASNPNTRGFDTYLGYHDQVKAHNYYPPYLWENGKRLDIPANLNGDKKVYSQDLFLQRTIDYLRAADNSKPFFLYLPYTLPHGEYSIAADSNYVSKDWTPEQKTYAAMVSRLDGDIGKVLEMVKQKGLENTLIIFTSDNGGVKQFSKFFASNGIYRGNKLDLYEGGIRVPMIVSWPVKIAAGTDTTVAAAWDLLPTLAAIADAKLPPGTDGINLVPAFMQQKMPQRPNLYWEYFDYNYNWNKPGNTLPRNYLLSKAARMGRWKVIKTDLYNNPAAAIQVYDLLTDPSETKDVALQHPEVVKAAEKYFLSSSTGSEYFPVK